MEIILLVIKDLKSKIEDLLLNGKSYFLLVHHEILYTVLF